MLTGSKVRFCPHWLNMTVEFSTNRYVNINQLFYSPEQLKVAFLTLINKRLRLKSDLFSSEQSNIPDTTFWALT